MKDKKYVFRSELNRTTFGNGEELYRYDVYEPYLKNYPGPLKKLENAKKN
jgi:hypothetical protein